MTTFHHDVMYPSVAALADVARKHHADRYPLGRRDPGSFEGVTSAFEAYGLAANGWADRIDETLRLAEDAVSTVERENDVQVWSPVYDIAGGSVDVGRFLSGDPECMIEMPPVRVAKVGKVVTLCVGISVSAAISPQNIIRRGRTIVALALALERLGYGFEIISDMTSKNTHRGGHNIRIRTIVKGVHDAVDAERIMYALAHPSYLRQLHFCAMHEASYKIRQSNGIRAGGGYGHVDSPERDLADGTLYTVGAKSSTDRDIADDLEGYLRELGIID